LLLTATNSIIAEEGNPRCDVGGWNCPTTKLVSLYKKRLAVAKDCGAGKNYDCFEQGRINYLNGGKTSANWGMFGGSPYKMILNNGMQLVIADSTNNCSYHEWSDLGVLDLCRLFIVDVNGEKSPNTFGRDIFYFVLKEDGLYPGGYDIDNRCVGTSGRGCAAKVLRDGAMNY